MDPTKEQTELIESIARAEGVRIRLTDELVPYYSRWSKEIRLPIRNIEKASRSDLLYIIYHEVGHFRARNSAREIFEFIVIMTALSLSVLFAFVALMIGVLLSPSSAMLVLLVHLPLLILFIPLTGLVVKLEPLRSIRVGSVVFIIYLSALIIVALFSYLPIILFGFAFPALFAAVIRLEKSVSEWRATTYAVKKLGAEICSKAKPWAEPPRLRVTAWDRFWFKILIPYYTYKREERIAIISERLKSERRAVPDRVRKGFWAARAKKRLDYRPKLP